jgi:beta-glucanase (GH16 family)
VAQVVKSTGAETWAGTTFLSLPTGELATTDRPLVTMRVWAPEAGTTVMLKLENSANGGEFFESSATTSKAAAWQTLSFDFSAANHALNLNRASVFFDFGTAGTGKTFYFDNVSFLNSANALGTPATLVFSDEFGGAVHDGASAAAAPAAHWTRETGTGNNGWGNGESQVYTNSLSNAFVEDGTLHIVANKTGSSITSARLKSDLPDLDPYGYMEIRAKLPSELGAWPAIWLLGNGTWPDTGEIDIVEWASMFPDTQAQAALHFKGDNNQTVTTYGNTSYKASTTLSSIIDTFHTYQLWWTPESIRIGVDGNVNTAHFEYLKPANATTSWWPFDNAMDIILNLAIGGTMGGAVPGGNFEYTMEVDYVRVYQQGTSFDASQVLSAVAGGNNAALLQSVAGAATAYTEIDLGHVQALVSSSGAQTLGEVDGLLTSSTTGALPRLASAGIDVLELDETLVDALGSAGIDLDASPLGSALQMTARPDAGEGSTAYLQASLLDLQKVGIDRVLTPDVTQAVVIALRDSGDSASLPSTTGGPFFVHRADQTVTVLLDQDDLTALLGQTGALDALAASGVTHLKTDTSVTAEGLQALSAALASGSLGLENTSALNPAELALLGLGIPPENPFGLPPL